MSESQQIDIQKFESGYVSPDGKVYGVTPVVPRVEFISATEVGFLYKENLITEDEARSFVGLKPKVKQ